LVDVLKKGVNMVKTPPQPPQQTPPTQTMAPQQTQPNPQPAEGTVTSSQASPQVPGEQPSPQESGNKTVNEVAQEVIAGYWGRGQKQKKRLADAGYDVTEVNEEVTKIFNR
jgi:N-acetylmuramoyl-L-alanine amidase